ncbi:EpsI family protein [Geobacter pelophilus]|uniref:EpsI family protein n=1 Tax=Geoanaerobacter pelophilus TaxID=60036 RepID=A0AAW4KWP8_9BACT|nr:exosortase C-terminal domain/associated protein EpsI [Geoanaerobacter pelophilus]MBT0662729.1 EpsI family protein [Geoanaerobacter pelophilus]
MGQINLLKILILVTMFVLTAFGLSLVKHVEPKPKDQKLVNALSVIDGWHISADQRLDQKVIDALELDDYLFQTYNKGNDTLTLYIGYYLTAKKVGSAHDPMVCFPGQGWCLTKLGQPVITEAVSGIPVTYSVMVAEREGRKELVAYWFQAVKKTLPDTFGQKVSLLRQRMAGSNEDNAFVRITLSLDNRSKEDAVKIVDDFIRSFYPNFLNYIIGDQPPKGTGIK